MNMTLRSTASLRYVSRRLVIVLLAVFWIVAPAVAQNTDVMGSVPSGPARNEVLRLTLRDALDMALRYNLGAIESGENAQIARGQRLLALSHLLPQVSAGINENVDQVNFTALGLAAIKIPGIPAVAGPFSYSTASASLSQTVFSYESIQRFRAARTAEQAAQLSYKDTLDVITLSVGNAYLEVIEAHSRIEFPRSRMACLVRLVA
jgi:outer membrane protein TolC